ncbi:PAS domain S-box protein [Acetobacteraceae bacterium AT-5844]|nr:PAS domain S-box protein [Acetobacteraceae bacterium AT-5844]
MHTAKGDRPADEVEQLLENPDLAGALESDRFKQFLDYLPIAIAVSDLRSDDTIIYANVEFERLSGHDRSSIVGKGWTTLYWKRAEAEAVGTLGASVVEDNDYLGTFIVGGGGVAGPVDAWANVIEDDAGTPTFRLVAIATKQDSAEGERQDLKDLLREKDTLLRELQHRVKNNLQMITALIRLESRNASSSTDVERWERLEGRVQSLSLLYQALSEEGCSEEVDLGVYLSQIASAVMAAHAPEGIRLQLQVDTWPVSINVAMPAGLVVNELLTNALKHAFPGRDGGTIRLHSLVDDVGCTVVVADDGIGMPEGASWPVPGKLGALIVSSLRENARADFEMSTEQAGGTTFTLRFKRAAATEA